MDLVCKKCGRTFAEIIQSNGSLNCNSEESGCICGTCDDLNKSGQFNTFVNHIKENCYKKIRQLLTSRKIKKLLDQDTASCLLNEIDRVKESDLQKTIEGY
jgi:hypothetical protein